MASSEKKAICAIFFVLVSFLVLRGLEKVSTETVLAVGASSILQLFLYIYLESRSHTHRKLLRNAEECGLENVLLDEGDQEDGSTLPDIVRSARSSALVSGLSLKQFHRDTGIVHSLENQLTNERDDDFSLKLLLLHPKCDHSEAHNLFRRNDLMSEIEKTIKSLKHSLEGLPENKRARLEVKLTCYLPRFRAILVDSDRCYISMYTFGSSAAENPQFYIRARSGNRKSWYQTISESVRGLYDSDHSIFLIKDGTWNEKWRTQLVNKTTVQDP